MNKILVTYLIAAVSTLLVGCGSTMNDTVEETQTTNKVDKQPLIIDIPEACNTGELTVKDADGNTYFHYTGVIDILNDGKDGTQIEIEILVPSEEETNSLDDQ